ENGRSKVNGGDKQITELRNGRMLPNGQTDYNTAGYQAAMRGGRSNIDYGYTSLHETMHFLGLSDRYDQNTFQPHKGYEADMMGGGTKIHQNHWDNWGKAILKVGSSEFILKHKVDMFGTGRIRNLVPENTSKQIK